MPAPIPGLLQVTTRWQAAVLPRRRVWVSSSVSARHCASCASSRNSTASPCARKDGGLPQPLAYSVELSLPHLPHRCPFVLSDSAVEAPDTAVDAVPQMASSSSNSPHELTHALLAPTSPAPVHAAWQRFVRLCDAVVQLGATTTPRRSRSGSSGTVRTSCGETPAAQHDLRPPRHALVGVVLPCKEPYFSEYEVARRTAADRTHAPSAAGPARRATSCLSTAQAALLLFHRHWHTPATLALNTTVPNRTPRAANPPAAPADHEAVRSHSSRTPAHTSSSPAATSAATADGIDAVVEDVVLRRGGRGLLLVRGDTPPDLQRGPGGCTSCDGPLSGALRAMHDTTITAAAADATAAHVSASPASSRAASWTAIEAPADPGLCTFHSGADLVRHVAAGRTAPSPPQLFVAGYPQGHPLDRQWGTAAATPASPDETTTTDAPPALLPAAPAVRRRSLAFLRDFEAHFDAAAPRYTSAVSTSAPASVPMPELRELHRTLGRVEAVRRLWTTPSAYPPDIRAACTRQLLRDKVRPAHYAAGQRAGDAAAPAAPTVTIVTQVLASAAEFEAYVREVRAALDDDGVAPHPQASPAIIPGVLLPHPTDVHVLLRSLYYAKVIPSARMQAALEAFALALATTWTHVAATPAARAGEDCDRSVVWTTALSAVPVAIQRDAVPDVEAAVRASRQRATARLAAAWEADTVELLRDLAVAGHTRVHLFTMFNDQVDRRVAQLLAAYDGDGGGGTRLVK